MSDELTERGSRTCRGCAADGLVSVLDLDRQPLSNEMARSQAEPSPTFPLHLRVCPACGLGQIGEYVLPERIFGAEYPYLSSVSTSWVAHAGAYADHMVDELSLAPGDLVMEVASNDGYLLTQMSERGMRVLGIEPALKVAEIARSRGVETVNDFFGLALAEQVAASHGRPRLIAANNVMAHVPDLQDFLRGLSHLCDDDTVVTVENPSFVTLMQETQFDTIYHEHFSYLSAHAVAAATRGVDLELTRVEKLTTHGGSNRYWLTRTGVHEAHPSVAAVLEEERAAGLLSPELWDDFARRSRSAIDGLRTWLDERRAGGRTVAGYGAAAKGNTLMNAAGVRSDDLVVVVDGSEAKQGTFLPGSHVPVAAPSTLAAAAPDDVLILPWNIAPEISGLVAGLVPDASCWIAIPEMRELG
ncbi:methyltransferase domain-containing protein [Nocardioides sp. T5]|uniref:methyltransferase domain-containing protein n=1 Tax=Nocardioides sp. T5 TaxID=3400182 RepID=UPI003A84B477